MVSINSSHCDADSGVRLRRGDMEDGRSIQLELHLNNREGGRYKQSLAELAILIYFVKSTVCYTGLQVCANLADYHHSEQHISMILSN